VGIGSRRIKTVSRIVRKLTDRERVYVAVRFLDIVPEDFRLLYETLYRRPLPEVPDPRDIEGSEPESLA
jgi:hypothetical protein